MNLHNNTLLITGGNSGIGLALVKAFYKLENTIIIAARDPQKMETVKKDLPGVILFPCDLTRQTDLDALLLFIREKHPGLNMLFNNAGIQYNYDFRTEPGLVQKTEYEINTNLVATIKLCGLLLPVLMKNENAAIVNVSSGLALSPKKSAPVYCATKAAVHQFTKALRYQLEETSVKVFEILPPLVDTSMTTGRGKNKLTPEALVAEFMRDFQKNKPESYIGKSKWLKRILRLSPKLGDRILKNS